MPKRDRMQRISAFTLDWLDRVGWCECQPPKDRCAVCQQKRDALRTTPKPYVGEARQTRKIDWE